MMKWPEVPVLLWEFLFIVIFSNQSQVQNLGVSFTAKVGSRGRLEGRVKTAFRAILRTINLHKMKVRRVIQEPGPLSAGAIEVVLSSS